MKKIIVLTLSLVFFAGIYQSFAQNKPMQLRHVVFFKFKEGTTEADIKTIVDGFKDLTKKIATIKAFEWGTNNSPEKLNEGLTHCFLVTFSSEKDRDNYLVDPAHKAFVEILKPHLDKPVVLDYWAQ